MTDDEYFAINGGPVFPVKTTDTLYHGMSVRTFLLGCALAGGQSLDSAIRTANHVLFDVNARHNSENVK